MSLTVTIYRPAIHGDATNGGVTSPERAPHGSVVLLLPEEDWPHIGWSNPRIPVLRAKYRENFKDWIAVPMADSPSAKTIGGMFGGNFVFTPDSRFRKMFGGPIPVHDRFETPEQYDRLTR